MSYAESRGVPSIGQPGVDFDHDRVVTVFSGDSAVRDAQSAVTRGRLARGVDQQVRARRYGGIGCAFTILGQGNNASIPTSIRHSNYARV